MRGQEKGAVELSSLEKRLDLNKFCGPMDVCGLRERTIDRRSKASLNRRL